MSDSLREALKELRSDLDRSYPDRAQYDIPSIVIDRLDAMLAAHSPAGHFHGETWLSGDRKGCTQAECREAEQSAA